MTNSIATALTRAMSRVDQSRGQKRMSGRFQKFAAQGYGGEDLLRRVAGIPLISECHHEDQPGPYCGLCGGLLR